MSVHQEGTSSQLGQSKATSQIVLKNIYSGEGYLQVGRATC